MLCPLGRQRPALLNRRLASHLPVHILQFLLRILNKLGVKFFDLDLPQLIFEFLALFPGEDFALECLV